MKKLLIIGLLLINNCYAQTTLIDAKAIKARDSLSINGKWIKAVITDSALNAVTAKDLATALAIKQFITNRLASLYLKDTFTSNITVNGTSFGKYNSGDVISSKGKTANEVIADAIIKAIPPTYNQSAASISSSVAAGSYEIGTNLSTITLSSVFNQNDAGAASTTTYSKFVSTWNNLGGNTDNLGTLTQATSYRVTISYGQGACKNNNLGAQDCTGRIAAGSVVSGNVTYTPFFKRYWGFSNSQSPDNASILGLNQDNNGNTTNLSLTNVTPSGSQYFVYFTKGTVSSIVVNGFPATAAFTITTYTVVNAQGHSSTYSYVYSNNLQSGTINSITIN